MPTIIALLSDVHANAPALRAVLKDARKFHCSDVWFLGDFLGYSPYPNESVQLLKKISAKAIIGNYDLKVLDFSQLKKKWKGKKDPAKYFSFAWTYENLNKKERRFLKQLPQERYCRVAGQKFLLVHGSPYGIEDGLDSQRDKKKLKKIAQDFKVRAVLCGHTHKSFAKKIHGVWFINPGSVGRSFDGDPRASYVLLKIGSSTLEVVQRRVKYPLAPLRKRMIKEKFPQILIDSVTTARSIDELQGEI